MQVASKSNHARHHTGATSRAADSWSITNTPTVLIQEGGYNVEDLGKNVAAFLQNFERARSADT